MAGTDRQQSRETADMRAREGSSSPGETQTDPFGENHPGLGRVRGKGQWAGNQKRGLAPLPAACRLCRDSRVRKAANSWRASTAPHKGQGLFVPQKLEPGNTLTDGHRPCIHSAHLELGPSLGGVQSGAYGMTPIPPCNCHSGQGRHRLAWMPHEQGRLPAARPTCLRSPGARMG